MSKSAMTDMTVGNPFSLIFFFSIPLLLGNVFQQLYNMVDSIIVGNFVSSQALAAVGTGFPIIFMISSLFMGVGIGATIMISQYYGAKDFVRLNKTIGTIYTSMLVGVIPLSLLGVLLTRPILLLTKVPEDTIGMAQTYCIVIFIGMIGSFGYNINAGILQGLGDSKTSLIFLSLACFINIILDIVFTLVFHWGVFGVAFATVIAQICSWLFGIAYINRKYTIIKIRLFPFQFDKTLFWQSIRFGIPSGLQQVLFSMGIMIMQSLVNSYGSDFMAGFNGASKIDSFAFMPIASFSTAVTTYTGQNIGAGKIERVRKGVHASLLMSIGTCILTAGLILPFARQILMLFSQKDAVLQSGVAYLYTVLPFFALLAIVFILNSVMRGAGEMMVPMISSFIALWLARLPAAYLLTAWFGEYSMFLSFAVGWTIGALLSGIYYLTGRWKTKSLVKAEKESL